MDPGAGFCRQCGSLGGKVLPSRQPVPSTSSGPVRGTRSSPEHIAVGDFVTIIGAGALIFALTRPWYKITALKPRIPHHWGVTLTSNPELVKPLQYPAGGWRWFILLAAAVLVVNSVASILATATTKAAPRWPRSGLALLAGLAALAGIVASYFIRPYLHVPHRFLLITPEPALYAAAGCAIFALVGVMLYSVYGPSKVRL